MARKVTLALIQMDCRLKDKEYNINKGIELLKKPENSMLTWHACRNSFRRVIIRELLGMNILFLQNQQMDQPISV